MELLISTLNGFPKKERYKATNKYLSVFNQSKIF